MITEKHLCSISSYIPAYSKQRCDNVIAANSFVVSNSSESKSLRRSVTIVGSFLMIDLAEGSDDRTP
ncbi:unnamed protein product [Schistosoma margrebowiei]|uniref:Uncharacterized protein n=1 Tax=Schistosoma margrebowiei TaxID=48269 RepID=A0A183LQ67_9TREM|nr:unnamed protein product [Schistosoma margrebowiei]